MITDLTSEFDIKDLGPLIQISKTSNGLVLSQQRYVQELLAKIEILDSKACDTPCLPYNRLLKDDGEPYFNPTLYRNVVGALQYLIFTRPDIAFSVHQVCQFMQNPMVSNLQVQGFHCWKAASLQVQGLIDMVPFKNRRLKNVYKTCSILVLLELATVPFLHLCC